MRAWIVFAFAATALGAGPIEPCRTGPLPFANGLMFTIPPGYCALVERHADFQTGELLNMKPGTHVLRFYAGYAGPAIDDIASPCSGKVVETVSGTLVQRSRASKGCRDSVWSHTGSASLFVFNYRALSARDAAAMDKLIDSVAMRAKPMFKGMELYSWKSGNAWKYALLVGTNRTKIDDEVLAAPISSVAELEAKLAMLGGGEYVTWENPDHAPFAIPPADVVAEIASFCNLAGIHFNGP